jgi:hypothetical protein
MSLLQSALTVLRGELSVSSDGISETVGDGSTAKRRRDEEKQDRAYDRAFKSNVATAMTGLSYSALMEQANNKHNQFMNYMELSCNEKFNDSMKAKFGTMADAALEAANEMERQAKHIKSQQVDLALLPDSAFETPNRSRPTTPAPTSSTNSTTNSTIESARLLDSDSD